MSVQQLTSGLRLTPAKLFFVGLIVLGWGLMFLHSMHAGGHHKMSMGWAFTDFANALFMWWIMVLAMMVPTLVSMFKSRENGPVEFRLTFRFIFGFVLAWTGFCVAATALQVGLKTNALLDMNNSSSASWLSAIVLVGAGLFQFTAAKQKHLKACRLSLKRLRNSDSNNKNPKALGVQYGADCIKCCWPVMLTMFVFGLMNIGAMFGLTVLMIVEKTVRQTELLAKLTGGLFIGAGLLVVVI